MVGFVRGCLLGAVLLGSGCGAPGPVPVKGIVKIDGKPLAHVSVLFNAQDSGGKDAYGSTAADGAFNLSTRQPNDGAMPGSYKITVQVSDPVVVSPELKSPEDVRKAMATAAPKRPSIVLPPTYTQLDQTILKHKVPEDGDVKLDLQSVKP